MANKYSDFSLNFSRHPITGDVSMVTEERSIAQSLKNILLTDTYEVPFNPNLAGNIRALLFKLSDPFVAEDVRTQVVQAIENYEPRIDLIKLDVRDSADGLTLIINITYRARTSTEVLSFEYYLDRVV